MDFLVIIVSLVLGVSLMTFVRHTTGCGRTRGTTPVSCRGGTMATRYQVTLAVSLSLPVHITTHVLVLAAYDYKDDATDT